MSVFLKGHSAARLFRVFLFILCLFSGLYSGASVAAEDPRCSSAVRTGVDATVKRSGAVAQDVIANTIRPTVNTSSMMKVPCKSNELQRIANQFAYAPTGYASSIVGQISGAAGPVSGLLNNMTRADQQSFAGLAKDFGGIFTGLGNLVQGQLNSLLGSIPGLSGSPFAGALCGIMADTLLKYIQCEVPITMPSLGNITGSLNKLLPKGCAGDALRGALYAAGSKQEFRPMNQSIVGAEGGIWSGTRAMFGPVPTPRN
ncbi:MAG: hypothetical protein EBQ96_03900 [Proteobacteria bacterium]|nr:hypothetical protein [Pseudomonadota bacterium]